MSDATKEQPIPAGAGVDVADWLSGKSTSFYQALAPMLQERAELGRERYGERLRAHNGRDAMTDMLQELLDAVMYGAQAVIEGRLRESWLRELVEFTNDFYEQRIKGKE